RYAGSFTSFTSLVAVALLLFSLYSYRSRYEAADYVERHDSIARLHLFLEPGGQCPPMDIFRHLDFVVVSRQLILQYDGGVTLISGEIDSDRSGYQVSGSGAVEIVEGGATLVLRPALWN